MKIELLEEDIEAAKNGRSVFAQSKGGEVGPSIECAVNVQLVRTERLLADAVQVRKETYGRHTPEMAAVLSLPETLDFAPESVVFVATDSVTSETLGSMRIMTNANAALDFENEVVLPAKFQDCRIALVQRLSILPGPRGAVAKKSLFKAFYLYAVAMQAEWMFLYTPPPRDRLFSRLGFDAALEGESVVRGRFSDFRDVRVLALRVWDVESLWRATLPEWHNFFFKQFTPGIKVFSSVSNWTKSSRARSAIGAS